IRDRNVTGVQTCALPILDAARRVTASLPDFSFAWSALALSSVPISHRAGYPDAANIGREGWTAAERSIRFDRKNPEGYMAEAGRSEERRVGKECRGGRAS